MFGVSVYAFMCHHSLPSIVAPIKNKSSVVRLFAIDVILILFTYVTLSWSAMFAFGTVQNPKCDPKPGNHSIEHFIDCINFIILFLAFYFDNVGPPCKIQSLYIFNFSSYRILLSLKRN
jgi:hypothetical protein